MVCTIASLAKSIETAVSYLAEASQCRAGGGEGHVRLNFATSSAILTEAVTRMGQAVLDLPRATLLPRQR
jgi:bifunctional pyridoxal-dependent enzyme with beta-cystathionase and maltose regulon repressor activities